MNMLQALRATIGSAHKLARPVTGPRNRTGYYVENNRVLFHDPTALAGDLRSVLKLHAHMMPSWEIVGGEWEVVEDGR